MFEVGRFCIILMNISSDKETIKSYDFNELKQIMHNTRDMGVFYKNIEYIDNQF